MNNTRGIVFHIIHGSFVDGPGIRTTVFLKGCPLRCVWCCNPEGQLLHPEVKLNAALCKACGACITGCPENAITLLTGETGSRVQINRSLCTGCMQCIATCPTGALDCFGRYYTVDELFEIVKKDEQFYRLSGGGVTVGGGEPTFQAAFTREFIKKCKDNYIHVALDTCGYTTTAEGLKVLEEADLLLFDLKGLDPRRHVAATGVSNERILENLKNLNAKGKPIIIRLPVIPGYNDSTANLQATAELLAQLRSVERVDLMPYHEYGKVKYEQLEKDYALNVKPLSRERQEELLAFFRNYGLPVQIGG
ncbi:glycyl-radical enzyme activating protein [Moorella sulfitireducens (nom. illeg.)]|uniref:glycyl-radical enzyme activating protein n=1 Tax=Neomoorella sulfitireducens TaxID=2972948 RepID=UPI0030F42206